MIKNHFKTKKTQKTDSLWFIGIYRFTSEVPKDDLQHMHPDAFFQILEVSKPQKAESATARHSEQLALGHDPALHRCLRHPQHTGF